MDGDVPVMVENDRLAKAHFQVRKISAGCLACMVGGLVTRDYYSKITTCH